MQSPRDFERFIFLVKLVNPQGQSLKVDEVVENVLVEIPIEHHFIHEGYHFILDDYDADVDTGAPKYWLLVTPDSCDRVHIYFKGSANKAGVFEIFEEPVITDNGTLLTPINNDRNSTIPSVLGAYYDPTVTNDGNRAAVGHVGGGRGVGAVGGVDKREDEFILKQNSNYLVKFTPEQDNTTVTLNLSWYELAE